MERHVRNALNAFLKKIPNSKFVPYMKGEAGTPDITGSIKGRSVWIETKTETGGKVSLKQKASHIEWRRAGALVIVTSDTATVKAELIKNNLI